MNSYFAYLDYGTLPIIDHSQSLAVVKQKSKKFLWNHFLQNLTIFLVILINFVPVVPRILHLTIIATSN